MKLSERIRKWFGDECGRKHQNVMDLWAEEVAQLEAINKDLLYACQSGVLQIEYLHRKFKETGSGNHTIARLQQAIRKAIG